MVRSAPVCEGTTAIEFVQTDRWKPGRTIRTRERQNSAQEASSPNCSWNGPHPNGPWVSEPISNTDSCACIRALRVTQAVPGFAESRNVFPPGSLHLNSDVRLRIHCTPERECSCQRQANRDISRETSAFHCCF